jgi:hypothetical protein
VDPEAQRNLYLALSALQYELNMSVAAAGGAVLNASNGAGLDALHSCMVDVYDKSRIAYGTPQDYGTIVSVRQMLGITGPRTDEVTGQTLNEATTMASLDSERRRVVARAAGPTSASVTPAPAALGVVQGSAETAARRAAPPLRFSFWMGACL